MDARTRKLNSATRRAHFAGQAAAQDLMLSVTEHDPEHEDGTISLMEKAAEQMEKSARDLRDGIAVFRDTKPST